MLGVKLMSQHSTVSIVYLSELESHIEFTAVFPVAVRPIWRIETDIETAVSQPLYYDAAETKET